MIQPGKWISDLTADTRVSDAARRVLTFRLEAVRDWLGQALREAGQDTEYVHQLRVATRRASAALDVFAACLPPKVAKEAKDRLKLIRRAAGEARDWDVFLGRLNETAAEPAGEECAGLDMLIGYALAQRIPAQAQAGKGQPGLPLRFRALHGRLPGRDSYQRREQADAERVRPPAAGKPARPVEPARPAGDRGFPRVASGPHSRQAAALCLGNLCRLFRTGVRKRLCPAVAELQEMLGSVNDHFNAAGLYSTLNAKLRICLPGGAVRYRGLIDRLRKEHESHLPAGRREFIQWCERWMQPEMQMAVAEIVAGSPLRHAGPAKSPSAALGAALERPLTTPDADVAARCA